MAQAIDDGLSQVTFGRVAKRLGISDRTVVYYFPTKDDLITNVIASMGTDLQAALAAAFPATADGHLDLVRAAWPVLATPEADPTFALFFEATGLAAAGRDPYASLVPQLIGAWVAWLMTMLDGDEGQRRSEAEATVAMVDGLLLLRQIQGPEAADRAASRLGVG